ncbi:hypothetical protein SAMN02745157_0682 [Kaistia soli DSM 19436]|uniref:GxxExxY protein n=1 Tax=Kaistia soli DSM 19436 TaxID=1122133 RepID=A0A1M4VEC5_9HYPH|nr:hypothetical protein [Kaistia soli]SHE67275.1 hypothetical protein SAMN02745157_0682 [Kaistia soli DSM 19436]
MTLRLLHLRGLIETARLDLSTEKATQADIEALFTARLQPGSIIREARLSAADIPDFLVGDVVVEVKIGGSAAEILRQLDRYAQHDRVGSLLLVTNVPMRLPQAIRGKPAAVARLGVSWI